jgi:hypothetical protein
MTREDAFALAGDIADAGYSCQIGIHIMPLVKGDPVPQESCHVSMSSTSYPEKDLLALVEIAKKREVHIHLINGEMSFFASSKPEVL